MAGIDTSDPLEHALPSWLPSLPLLPAIICIAVAIAIAVAHTAATATTPRPKLPRSIAFFHPYCDGGGGGERVLWAAIQALLRVTHRRDVVLYVYARKEVGRPEELAARVKNQFNITIDATRLNLVYLKHTEWLDAKRYPFMTLIMQSLASMLVVYQALRALKPDVFIETTGFAFTSPIAKWSACRVVSYVHYPTISTDMLRKVESRVVDFNNVGFIAASVFWTRLKSWYYQFFALLYGFAGSYADIVMVNSTWTLNHINELWRIPNRTSIVYPPCDFASLQSLPIDKRQNLIISVAQFRPEKAHPLQIEAFSKLVQSHPELTGMKLVLLGSSRNSEDAARIQALEQLVSKYGLQDRVIFEVNAPYSKLREYLGTGLIGLHTMWNEHFGISIVEYMGAGLIVVAHNSGGPKSDIVTDSYEHGISGFLATTVDDFAHALYRAATLSPQQRLGIIEHGRLKTQAFSNQAFEKAFVQPMLELLAVYR
ncbi:GDP-Man:Man3GlcNAc2-PP-dolichol alpha-1,2-mannosyltransferase [Synchytrium endobioticum]|uniref:GDP-Man:Man(3)GlcNAc(2)-PP-Dol alpha-1,2-mannosyltransferase n=1 Tax=Synchytrium endobioticum TaxID=286115 RepID=A0A507CQ43_9FUNG|nr:GDP-Man:Man3GlcNAc2-PP-dolichol alpha-1,2-mannosyltransferase [Synchytrium endobioticum]TPX44739.1 GDP-Man:Man3GlcNAc2-PP-dolichol alpha-1,2-mannosyltransferase [Synchytrium endobioticum]